MKLYMTLVLTIVMYGIYLIGERVLRMRRARRELRKRRIWWHALNRAYEVEKEAEETILGV